MDDTITMAIVLGRALSSPDQFAQATAECADRDLAADLMFVAASVVTLRDTPFFAYVDTHVWGSETRTAFFLQVPLERYLVSVAASPARLTVDDIDHFSFLARVIDHGGRVESIAAAVVPAIVRICGARSTHVKAMCALLVEIARVVPSHLIDAQLFHGLANHVAVAPDVIDVILAGSLWDVDAVDVIFPVVIQCVRVMIRNMRYPAGRRAPVDCAMQYKALELLERCASTVHWRPLLVPHVVAIGRRGWPVSMGQLMAHALSDTSVEIVLRLEWAMRLEPLVEAAGTFADHNLAWRAVRGLLRTKWPARVGAIEPLGGAGASCAATLARVRDGCQKKVEEATGATEDAYSCPITLAPFVHPVVASDGHTYERDALMQHLALSGMISPMTKSKLSFHVFPNFCIPK